ncbi:mogroside IE synthase-like [Argentina anserina]|uniref:mogroside IE synthase-like n=1 Tax=Argentina anserina TaxID=57926 RepID=UPI0021768DD2|nr:mogroside IE synthase-like [Potentilla anserina]
MEKQQQRVYKAHCLVFTYPSQGHINPLLQFSKLLDRKGVKVTLVTTRYIYKTMYRGSSCTALDTISLETISDGYDEEGWKTLGISVQAYLDSFRKAGSQTLAELLQKLSCSGCPVDCLVYDAFMPWPLDIAKKFGIPGAVFFTQSCAVDNIYNHVNKGLLKLPLTDSEISLPGMPPLEPSDLPSFLSDYGSYPAFFELVIGQFCNVDKADWVLCNTFYELEEQVVDWMAKFWPVKTIGPTIPSKYLDNRLEDDKDYGVNLFKSDSDACMKWLNQHPKNSVAYISFGSAARLGQEQMEELALGLKMSKGKFLWVVRESEAAKVPENFIEETTEKGLVVSWCSQLEVLAHEAVGCFITHCGWNSTLESLSLGVPLVGIPQWTDQSTNAKYIRDVWKIGIKAQPDEEGIVRRAEVEHCISEIMEGHRGKELRKNAMKWKDLAQKAVDEGGSSDKNIDEFIETLIKR